MNRQATRLVLAAAFGLVATAAPAVVERMARSRLARAAQACLEQGSGNCVGARAVHVDLSGVHLEDAALRRGGIQARASRVDLRLGDGVLEVSVEGLEGRLSRSEGDDPAGENSGGEGLRARLAAWRGAPVRVRTSGRIELDAGDRLGTIALVDPGLFLPADGSLQAETTIEGSLAGLRVRSTSPARIELPDLRDNQMRGQAVLAVGDTSSGIQGEAGPEGELAVLHTRNGGQARILPTDRGVAVQATRLALAPFAPMLEGRLGEAEADLDGATLDGTLRLDRRDGALQLDLEAVQLTALAVAHPNLADEPVKVEALGLDGRLALEATGALRADLQVEHRGATVSAHAELSTEAVDVALALQPIECQDLLDAAPEGFLPALQGMRLDGQTTASFHVAYRTEDVLSAHQRELETGEPQPAPGVLEVDLPFASECTVLADPAAIDLEGLATAYRHRFVRPDGRADARILAEGAPGFAPIASVPRLARSFVVMEDTRYFEHDGFDHQQLERALWHNLAVGRAERGASTITQQTARNLWLGGSRTASRKLQEAVLASRLEQALSKDRILEIYLNIIELGPDVFGVEEAAQFHFDRSAAALEQLQALHVAALAPAPVTYSRRFASGEVDEAWRANLETQAHRLRLHGMISPETEAIAQRSDLALEPHAR